MLINYSVLNTRADAFIHFLEETLVEFHTEVERLSSSEIESFHF